MIGTLLRLPLFAMIGLTLAWGLALLFRNPVSPTNDALTDFSAAFPRPENRTSLWGGALHASRAIRARAEDVLGERGKAAGPLIATTWIHLKVVETMLPYVLALLAAGILAGVALRERIRFGRGYASPTAAHLARLLFSSGLLWFIVFTLSPIPAAAWSLYAAALACFLGGLCYAANLPIAL